MIMCVQCVMKAMIEGKSPPTFPNETEEEHIRKHHPDPVATKRERLELERKLAEKFKDQEK